MMRMFRGYFMAMVAACTALMSSAVAFTMLALDYLFTPDPARALAAAPVAPRAQGGVQTAAFQRRVGESARRARYRRRALGVFGTPALA